MNYLVAVLADRIRAEAAYSALEEKGLPNQQISIVGAGYQSADEFGLIDPNSQAGKRSGQLAYWLIPFGFAAGYLFNLLTGIEIIGWLGPLGNHLLGGLLGAVSAILGALFVGGAVGWTVGSGDALVYRNRINSGKYLIVVKGDESIVQAATPILRQFEPENLQGYTESTK
ncbi:hypothetical protein [Thermocoleostomius sinensis]|uniref:DUF1269 domain-containing protein n=1 Tax=Thermocoleostomius sinensis A174 TaxID=2016057 RepID=A0A9E8ZAW2_9CYAN|nr:hypothetical protein [Thermocoleostomius sinensis]WAL58028.1 hypothetical protein OXH18_12550 [Thermocoleostomius sinensis A174]